MLNKVLFSLLLNGLWLLMVHAQSTKNPFQKYIPKGHVMFEVIEGDINMDGLQDAVLIIKGTRKDHYFQDENRGQLDRNRRGLLVLLNSKTGYKEFLRNDTCFSSENEDGGVYFAPDLVVEIAPGNLFIRYLHGRYGAWAYQFRIHKLDFDLIGYESLNNRGPVTESITSVNFLTRKMKFSENTNKDAETDGEEVFKDTWRRIKPKELIQLSKVVDFDELFRSHDF